MKILSDCCASSCSLVARRKPGRLVRAKRNRPRRDAGDGQRAAYASKSAPIASCGSPRWRMKISICPRASWSWAEARAAALQGGEAQGDDVVLATAQLVARVSLANGAVRFTDLAGKPLLAGDSRPVLEKGVSQRFNSGTDEAFFGLGPAPERADEPQRRRRRARAAQHGHRRAVRGVDAATTACYGTTTASRASATRSPMASRRAISRSAMRRARKAASRRVTPSTGSSSSSASKRTSTTSTSATASTGRRNCSGQGAAHGLAA